MTNYKGVIIEESLADKDILKKVKIISTKIEKVTAKHRTPWFTQWTLRTVEVPANEAQEIAEEISKSLDPEHGGSWYADFKNDKNHYIIFRHKIFLIDIHSQEQYDQARQYGLSLGIPEYQVDFKAGPTESLLEDLEALGSKKYLAQIRKARAEKKTVSASQVKKRLKIG